MRGSPRACGSSTSSMIVSMLSRDHPRACGEQCSYSSFLSFGADSPRACGEQKVIAARERQDGITPAHAGSRCFSIRLGDMPRITRACGEQCKGAEQSQQQRDHPRMREQHSIKNHVTNRRRITPAHAGQQYS